MTGEATHGDPVRSQPADGGPAHTGAEPPTAVVDSRGRRCPIPIIELARHIGDVEVGQLVELRADDPAAAADVAAWCRMRGHDLVTTGTVTTGTAPPGGGEAYVVRRRH